MPSHSVAGINPYLARRLDKFLPPQMVWISIAMAVFGLLSIYTPVVLLWHSWLHSPLKSIGIVFPPISLVLILRAWKRLDWEMDGTWWGLILLAATIAAVHLRAHALLEFILTPRWTIFFPPNPLVVVAYATGIVLFVGGTRLLRAAIFPLFLLCFVNPVPHTFNVLVDLPLQHVSAHIARGFAIALGQKLTPDQLRLMFTPDFGMFIAPGCDGIRGAVTMGYIALIAGYLYRFRLARHALVVVLAVLLGYVFNLVRLCVLVLYYLVALHIPSLQPKAEMADYIIGACLFCIATALLFLSLQHFGSTTPETPTPVSHASRNPRRFASSPVLRFSALLLLLLAGSYSYVHARLLARHAMPIAANPLVPGRFPDRLGVYTLARTWKENNVGGPVLFYWAEYIPADAGTHVSIGISPILGAHDTLICHSARGEDPLWVSAISFPTAADATSFNASFFNDGATQYVEATTLCTGSSCGEYSSSRTHFGFVYSHVPAQAMLSGDPGRAIPILLRAETTDTALPAEAARRQLLSSISDLLAKTSLSALTAPYRNN